MAFDHSKFLARFVEEAREHCARLSEGFLSLEKSPGDPETVNAVFRSAHTIKGSARMMKLPGVSSLAHAMEDVLDAARGGKLILGREVFDVLFQALDELTAMLGRIAAGEKPEAPEELCARLKAFALPQAEGQPTQAVAQPEQACAPTPVEPDAPVHGLEAQVCQPESAPETAPQAQADYLRVNAAKLDDLVRLMGEIISEQNRMKHTWQRLRDIERQGARLARLASQGTGAGEGLAARKKLSESASSLAAALRQTGSSLKEAAAMQDHLMAELRDTSLKLRMLPLSTVFDPLRRTVRDLSREFGKDIDFTVTGQETELDRKIAERIGECLVHLIRNALDHGLESPEERVAAGKPARGRIELSAYYDSGGVTIALSDDGRGVDTERVREKARSKRLFDAETLGRMSRAEVNNLIFLPGFSTSRIITDISGRGVGMDAVRKSVVDDLRGAILVDTTEGQGTTFVLRLPLNLAVFPLFLVRSRQKACALPATHIVEMLAVSHEEIIEIVNKRAIRLREQIVPVEELSAILRLPQETGADAARATIVVVRDGETKLGLIVDEIIGREEMVVKPLPAHLKNVRLVTGGTITAGGDIVNVLHVPELMRLARDMSGQGRKAEAGEEDQGARILVVDDSINTREIEKSILEAYGYQVDTAEDGEEALERTREALFDLVITDVEMPRLDGFSLTEKLRADQRFRNVPIIIVTSLEKEEDKKRGIAVGADAYIVKRAFDQSNLLETVKSLIG